MCVCVCVVVCCVTSSGSLGYFQPPERRRSVLLSHHDTFLLSIVLSVQQSHRLCSAMRHVRERVRACVSAHAFVCRVCVLMPHSLAKSPPPQVGQLRNGRWNRHGNSSPRQASQCRTFGGSQTERYVSSPKHCPVVSRQTPSVNEPGLKTRPLCSFALFSLMKSEMA